VPRRLRWRIDPSNTRVLAVVAGLYKYTLIMRLTLILTGSLMQHDGDMLMPIRKPQQKLAMVASLAELRREHWVPFTLGAVYAYGVPFDIVARFVAEYHGEFALSYVEFDFQIAQLPEPYDHMLFTMLDVAYAAFVPWFESVELIHREEQRYGRPIRTAAAIQDPFMCYVAAQQPRPELIDVWTVAHMGGTIVPAGHVETLPYPIFRDGEAADLARDEFLRRLPTPQSAPQSITFTNKQSDIRVVARGRALLGGRFD